jgi:hypothetical protein
VQQKVAPPVPVPQSLPMPSAGLHFARVRLSHTLSDNGLSGDEKRSIV